MGTRGHETSCPGRCQLLAFQQLSAPLTLLRTGWLHSIMIFSPGAEQALIIHLHDGERGEKKKKKDKEKKKKNHKANPGFQMVKFHIGPGRRLGDSILLAVRPAPGLASRFPRVPTPPPAQPLRPGAAGRLGTGSLWPRAESRAGRRGCQPRGGGVCDRAGAGEGGAETWWREREGGKRREWRKEKKKKFPG